RSRVRDVRPARQGAQPGGRPRAALLLFGRVPRQVSRAHRMTTESSLRADIVEVGRRMYARGYTASNDGNISVRLGTDRLLMTPSAEYATPSTSELPEAVRKYIKAHDGMLLANHGALTVGADLFGAYYKMETIEHFAKISLVARLLGRENLIAREEVLRLQELRGTYGIQAPAPICPDPSTLGDLFGGGADPATCQIVEAPQGGGLRLVPDSAEGPRAGKSDDEAEIRLTY